MSNIDELFRAAINYKVRRETFFRMPDGQKNLVKADFESAEKKLEASINEIIDNRLRQLMSGDFFSKSFTKIDAEAVEEIGAGEKIPDDVISQTPEAEKGTPDNDTAPEPDGTSDADIFE